MDAEQVTLIPQTQFNIYKLDQDLLSTYLQIAEVPGDDQYLCSLCDAFIDNIADKVSRKEHEFYTSFFSRGFIGIVYKTIHYPSWRDVLLDFSNGSLSDDSITNTNVSYVMLYMKDTSIYAMTGGYGSNFLEKVIERNFGLNLIPKIIDRNNAVIKRVLENNLTGNRASSARANRTNTTIVSEQDLSSIYKELALQLDKDIAEFLGIELHQGEKIDKKVNILTKDSLTIRRSLSIEELIAVLGRLNSLENVEDNFILNYLVPVKKKGITNTELTNALIDSFCEGQIENFSLIGDDYDLYYFNAHRYSLLQSDGGYFIRDSGEPFSLQDVYTMLCQNTRITKSLITDFIKKWQVITTDESGNTSLFPHAILSMLQGYIEYGPQHILCHLLNGSWYILDAKYSQVLNEDFENFHQQKNIDSLQIKEHFALAKNFENEDLYNNSFSNRNDFFIGHTHIIGNIEIADLIFFNEQYLFLMHNKMTFNGNGARDLLNQILTASEYLQKQLLLDRLQFVRSYYEKLGLNPDTISLEEFNRLFDRKICFIAGFIEGYRFDSRSTYAKYLLLELNRRLTAKGQTLIPMAITA